MPMATYPYLTPGERDHHLRNLEEHIRWAEDPEYTSPALVESWGPVDREMIAALRELNAYYGADLCTVTSCYGFRNGKAWVRFRFTPRGFLTFVEHIVPTLPDHLFEVRAVHEASGPQPYGVRLGWFVLWAANTPRLLELLLTCFRNAWPTTVRG